MNKNLTVGKQKINSLFDAGTFVEMGAYIKRCDSSDVYDGIICGYGSISGKLTFAFVQDSDRMMGAFDAVGAKKIESLYDTAIKNGAPIIGIFDSAGAVVLDGSSALSSYGKFMNCVSRASGIIPQIAIIDGPCTGMGLTVASMFDIAIKVEGSAVTYITPDNKDGDCIRFAVKANDEASAFASARELIEILPQNNKDNACDMSGDAPSRSVSIEGLTGCELIRAIADNGKAVELYADTAKCVSVGFAFMGGILCGVIATNTKSKNNGKLCACGAKKASEMISFCDRFGISVITLIDSEGICHGESAESFAALATSYANATCPKISAVVGKAYGASFTLMGSKSIGADMEFAVEGSYISTMSPESGVAFLMNDEITHEKNRAEVEREWCEKYASAIHAAECGDIDDIIAPEELRARICSALYMLASKTDGTPDRKYARLPL